MKIYQFFRGGANWASPMFTIEAEGHVIHPGGTIELVAISEELNHRGRPSTKVIAIFSPEYSIKVFDKPAQP